MVSDKRMDKNCLILSNSPLLESSGSGYVILNYSMGLRKKGFSVDLFGPEHYLAFPNTATGLTYRKAAGMLGCALKQMLKKNTIWLSSGVPRRGWLP